MSKKQTTNIDFAVLQERVQRQFRNLDPKDPSLWPALPRGLLYAFVATGVAALLWFGKVTDYQMELEAEQAKEVTLRENYQKKLVKAVSLEALKQQREQIQQNVTQLEKQLPSKAEMAALLSDINQAGLGRSLQFDLFRPGQVVVKDYYAELPISVKISGGFHDMGMFASDIAHLPRIVTLNNLSIAPKGSDGALTLEATARTYRYLDAEEVKAHRKGAAKK